MTNKTEKFLSKHGVKFTVDNGKVVVPGGLYLNNVTTLPENFAPTVKGAIYLNKVTRLSEGFNPTVGDALILRGVTTLPENFAPTVGGTLDLRSVTSVPEGFAPTVGGGLYLRSVTSVPEGFAPTVGGWLYLRSVTSVPEGFAPTVGGGLYLDSYKGKRPAVTHPEEGFLEKAFNEIGYTFADKILARVISTRGNIKKVLIVGQKKPSWLASKDGYHAHAATARDALTELAFKCEDRDVSEFQEMPLDTVKTPTEWALIYRLCTGACQQGTALFMSQHKLKKSYTLAEILEATKNAYGYQRFKEVVAQ